MLSSVRTEQCFISNPLFLEENKYVELEVGGSATADLSVGS